MTHAAPATADVAFDEVKAVADAILYEGYLLYPYRRSAPKNRVRWQFGVLVPPGWAKAHGLEDTSVAGSAESWWQQTECLLQADPEATVRLRLRFLQLRRRWVEELAPDGTFQPAGRLEVGGRTELSFDEAVPREFDLSVCLDRLVCGPVTLDIRAGGGEEREPFPDGAGRLAGRVRRRTQPVRAALTASAEVCDDSHGLIRLRVRVENVGDGLDPAAPREQALGVSLLATHLLAGVEAGEFVSLLDPPGWAGPAARACANVHAFPVLAGEPGQRGLVLSAPILLPDYPQVSPESPGDLHDATEIDEILSLRALTLTEAEKQEARATDPRAAQILDRIDAMPPEVMGRLHGAVRSLRPTGRAAPSMAQPAGPTPPAQAGTQARRSTGPAVQAADASVVIAGVRVSAGSRIRLRPRTRGSDAQDMFLTGRTARVEKVMADVDGGWQLAVALDDDPGADLDTWYGRFRYFTPAEVEPIPAGG